MNDLLTTVGEWLEYELFTLGDATIRLWTVAYLIISFALLVIASGWLRTWISERALRRYDVGVRQAAGKLIRYVVIALGTVVLLQTAGIDLTALNVLAGAVGIGVGFGLQNIANNFMSGLIILFERPIKVGDRIEVDDVNGVVQGINTRSTTVLTNDNIAIIIPNAKLISENVVNWSYTDDQIRFRIPVGVSYGSDVELVKRLLLEVAAENPDVLEDPEPAVRFLGFGDSALDFQIWVWTSSLIHKPNRLRSDLNFAILKRFREHDVEIPFPQRDLHVRSGLDVLARAGNGASAEAGGTR